MRRLPPPPPAEITFAKEEEEEEEGALRARLQPRPPPLPLRSLFFHTPAYFLSLLRSFNTFCHQLHISVTFSSDPLCRYLTRAAQRASGRGGGGPDLCTVNKSLRGLQLVLLTASRRDFFKFFFISIRAKPVRNGTRPNPMVIIMCLTGGGVSGVTLPPQLLDVTPARVECLPSLLIGCCSRLVYSPTAARRPSAGWSWPPPEQPCITSNNENPKPPPKSAYLALCL